LLLIVCVLIPTTVLLIGFAIFESVINHGFSWLSLEAGADLIYVLFYLITVIGAPVLALFLYKRKIRESAALERVENYVQGAIKEKIIHRELKEWEKFFLEEKYKETKNKDYDLDRRAPIFRIQGNLVTLSLVSNEVIKLKEEWNVRGFKMNEENFPDIRYKIFAEGEEVAVEFSPFSKWVWDVYKIVNGKRDWLMQLSNENFGLLKSGQIKVIPRAPYGTHRLEEIKRGDFITFNNMGIGVTVDVEVEYIKHYKTAEDLLKAEGVENVYPQVKSFEEAAHFLNSIENYYKRIQKGGIYAIRVGLLKS